MTDTTPAMTQDTIRQWAWVKGLPVGRRGRVPNYIVEQYNETIDGAGTEVSAPERPGQTPSPPTSSFDPLEDYLAPRFGNLYEQYDELGANWTQPLKEAVTQYLLHEVTEADFEDLCNIQLISRPTGDTRAARIQSIIERDSVFDVAFALHALAVKHAPSLDAVLEENASRIGHKIDCARWLYENGDYNQLVEVARISGLLRELEGEVPEVLPPGADEHDARFWLTDELIDHLSCTALAEAWHFVTTSTTTDLTDEDWSLLEPLLPTHGSAKLVPSTTRRQVINGLLFLQAHPERRLRLPYSYRRNYRLGGIFARMLTVLDGRPEAERLVTWLRTELKESSSVSQEGPHD
jgi:hypothetical protein